METELQPAFVGNIFGTKRFSYHAVITKTININIYLMFFKILVSFLSGLSNPHGPDHPLTTSRVSDELYSSMS